MAPRVRFNAEQTVVNVEHYRDMPKEEIKRLWFSKKESYEMKRKQWSLAKAVERGTAPENTCLRGLEAVPPSQQYQIEVVVSDVIIECLRQKDEGVWEPDEIRRIYRTSSASFRMAAKERGLADAKASGHEELMKDQAPENNIDIMIKKGCFQSSSPPLSPVVQKKGLSANLKHFMERSRRGKI